MGLNRECVEFFIDGRNAWQAGLLGFFSRKRGIIGPVAITFISATSSPWWWPKNLQPIEIKVELGSILVWFVIVMACIYCIGLMYLRYRSKRSLEIKYMLHQLEHYLRNHQTEMFELASSGIDTTYEMFEEKFKRYLSETIHKYREYFRCLTADKTIELAVRLAIDTSDYNNGLCIVYRTMARTSGLNDGRKSTSEDITPNEGIARFLIEEKDCKGALLYNDIHAAARMGAFKITESEREYPEEIITMMVVPLNGWDGDIKEKSMLGILFITSRNKKTFSVKHTDSALFAADMFSRSLVNTIELFSEHKKRIGRQK
jgi:hypothetical protein